jgi:hypothetical protein
MASTSIPAHLTAQIGALGIKLGLPEDEMCEVANTLLAMKSSDGPTKSKSPSKSPSKPREAPSDGERCCARVWGEGAGTQCKAKRNGGDYCKMHLKKIEEAGGSQDPCLLGTDGDLKGKRIGLFWGRADHPKTGKNPAGQWVVYWNDETIRAEIRAEQEAGTYVVADCGLRKGTDVCPGAKSTMVATKKPKAAKAPKVPKAKSAKKDKVDKPKKPRGRTAFFVFMADNRPTIVSEIKAAVDDHEALMAMGVTADQIEKGILTKTGSVSLGAVGKVGGKKWAEFGDEGQAPFKATADAEKAVLLAEWEASTPTPTPVPTPAPTPAPTPVPTPVPTPTLVGPTSTDAVAPDVFSDSDDEDEEDAGMWNYTTPAGIEAVVADMDGAYIAVSSEWWEANEEASDDDIVANSIGTLTQVKIPDEDDEDIIGTFTSK